MTPRSLLVLCAAALATFQFAFVSHPGVSNPKPFYAPKSNDLAVDLVDELAVDGIHVMAENNLQSAALEVQPWSDDYWPTYSGQLAKRYADPYFPTGEDWSNYVNYLVRNVGNASSVDQLSPAEKYDLLVGDPNWSLTSAMLKSGQTEYTTFGKVETWQGICHGWAPASFMVPRPRKSVDVLAADGRTVLHFYPSDLKALASLLWANTEFESRFVGSRCEQEEVRRDSRGRPTNEKCLDTNAGTWHLSVVNQIGVNNRSLIMDITAGKEVWNQPIQSYSYRLFNPQLRKYVRDWQDGLVRASDFVEDPYAGTRGSKTSYLVGVVMNLTYVAESKPRATNTDSPERDVLKTIELVYDLEIDAYGRIVGGEWWSDNHPDFLWTASKKAHPQTAGDLALSPNSRWNSSERPLPGTWRQAAMMVSPQAQPLARIVNQLIAISALEN